MTPGRSSNISFFNEGTQTSIRNISALKDFIQTIFKKEKKTLDSLNYIFCTDKKLLEINQNWLNHQDYTDIISFDLSDDPKTIAGEIYISPKRVKENAKALGNTFREELHRVIFHGALHLCGYQDKTLADKQRMRKKEDQLLENYL